MLNTLFRRLGEQRDVPGNPFAGMTKRGEQRTAPFDTSLAFTDREWQAVRSLADRLEGSHGWQASGAQGLRFLLEFLLRDEAAGA